METTDNEFDTSLQRLAALAGYDTRSYSGRGMGGVPCLGVTLEVGQTPFKFMADMLKEVASLVSSNMNGDELDFLLDTISNLQEALTSAQTDSMGMGTILYFPGVRYVLTAADEEGCPEFDGSSESPHHRYGDD
jgi:hypothetical protein